MARKSESLVYVGIKAHVIAFHRKSGAEVWRTQLPAKYKTSASFVNVVRDADGLFATCGGEVFALDPDPAAIAFGEFVFGESYKEPARGPSFLIRLGRKISPDMLDGWQAQFIEHQAQALCVDHGSRAHAASPCSISPS